MNQPDVDVPSCAQLFDEEVLETREGVRPSGDTALSPRLLDKVGAGTRTKAWRCHWAWTQTIMEMIIGLGMRAAPTVDES